MSKISIFGWDFNVCAICHAYIACVRNIFTSTVADSIGSEYNTIQPTFPTFQTMDWGRSNSTFNCPTR